MNLRFPRLRPPGRSDAERGATAVEYGIIVALISAVLIGSINLLGGNLSTVFSRLSLAVAGSSSVTPPVTSCDEAAAAELIATTPSARWAAVDTVEFSDSEWAQRAVDCGFTFAAGENEKFSIWYDLTGTTSTGVPAGPVEGDIVDDDGMILASDYAAPFYLGFAGPSVTAGKLVFASRQVFRSDGNYSLPEATYASMEDAWAAGEANAQAYAVDLVNMIVADRQAEDPGSTLSGENVVVRDRLPGWHYMSVTSPFYEQRSWYWWSPDREPSSFDSPE